MVLIIFSMLYITSPVLTYNWKFVPLTPFILSLSPHRPPTPTNLISFSMIDCLWSIMDLQHYVSFWCTTQWFSISIHFKVITTRLTFLKGSGHVLCSMHVCLITLVSYLAQWMSLPTAQREASYMSSRWLSFDISSFSHLLNSSLESAFDTSHHLCVTSPLFRSLGKTLIKNMWK